MPAVTVPLDASDYLVGLVFFGGTWGFVALAAAVIVRRRLGGIRGVPRILAFSLLATGGLIGVHLLPGLVGELSRVSALICAGLVAGLASLLTTVESSPEPAARTPPSSAFSWAVAAAGTLVVAAGTLAAARVGTVEASTDIDTLTFHIPNVARWMQTGSFWQVDNFSPLLANGNYPQNGDVVQLAVIQPFQSDAFARVVNVPFAVMAGLAVYAIAVETGAARATGALMGALFTALPAFIFATGEGAKTDPVMLATFGAGLLFLMRHFRTSRRSDLLLAGIGLGLAFGTKWYAVSSVAGLLVVWGGFWIWARRPIRALARNATMLIATIAGAGGFWLLRNLVESGNPVFPTKIAPGGATIFDAPHDFIRECGGFTLLGYIDAPGVWKDFILPDFRDNFGLPGLLLFVGFALAVVLLVRRQEQPGRSRVGPLLLTTAAAVLALCYAATPYSAFGAENEPDLVGANTRWFLPALLVASALLAWAAGSSGWRRRAIELVTLVAIIDGARRGFGESLGRVVVAGLLLLAAALTLLAIGSLVKRGVLGRAVATSGLCVAVLASVVVVGNQRQRAFYELRYAEGDPVITWFREHPREQRVGLAGVWTTSGLSPVLPAFGPRLENPVEFVGRYERGQLREYEQRAAFLGAVAGGGYELLIVGKGGYGDCRVPGREGDERRWALSAGYVRLAESERLALFRVPR